MNGIVLLFSMTGPAEHNTHNTTTHNTTTHNTTTYNTTTHNTTTQRHTQYTHTTRHDTTATLSLIVIFTNKIMAEVLGAVASAMAVVQAAGKVWSTGWKYYRV